MFHGGENRAKKNIGLWRKWGDGEDVAQGLHVFLGEKIGLKRK